MIRHNVTTGQIEAAVDSLAPQWRTKAAQRTAKFINAKKFDDPAPIWSDVKAVFVELQRQKCVFCERQFETVELGKIEYDLEHFRPKSSVTPWPPANWKSSYDFPLGKISSAGYYWLAYALENYAASCKVCNSPLKSNYFPIAGKRGKAGASVTKLAAEEPYLCYPIGDGDDDPESLVTFIATTAVPAVKSGHGNRRGKIIIDFFQLNGRDQLHRERARMIALMGGALRGIELNDDIVRNQRVVTLMLAPSVPHSACVRAFNRLWEADRPLAKRVYDLCRDFAFSATNTPPPNP